MKFRVKLTLSIILVLSLAFGAGGSLLISVSFSAALDSARETALRSYRVVQNTLLLANSISTQSDTRDIAETLSQIYRQNGSLWSGAQLADGSGTLFESGVRLPESRAEEGVCRVGVFSRGDAAYVQVSGVFRANGEELALSLCTDCTQIYAARDTELAIYRRLLVAVIFVGAVSSWLIAVMLTRPLAKLQRATRELAGGNLACRANIRSGDELEALSRDFNAMAAELQRSMGALTDAMQRQEEFMGGFAHELKTPMTSIIGYADLLRSRNLSEDERLEAAGYIFSEGRRLESLSLKLLDLLVLKRQDFELREGSPGAVVAAVVRVMKPQLQKQGIDIRYRCDNAVCPIEPDLLKSLLINLIDNGRKAIEGTGSIFLLERAAGSGCRIQIADTGRGIPKQEIRRITEAFYRVDKSRSRAQGGVGLGLALCGEIVKLHRGTMEIESIEGKGTSVLITLNGGTA